MPRSRPIAGADAWARRWLDSVTASAMTQRKLASVRAHGGVATLRRLARERGIHLVQLVDDRGVTLVAASRHPFKVIC